MWIKLPNSKVSNLVAVIGLAIPTDDTEGGHQSGYHVHDRKSDLQGPMSDLIITRLCTQSASTALAAIVCTTLALSISVDTNHRVRTDRVLTGPHGLWKGRDAILNKVISGARRAGQNIWRRMSSSGPRDEERSLLG